jgi:hypothetical protein
MKQKMLLVLAVAIVSAAAILVTGTYGQLGKQLAGRFSTPQPSLRRSRPSIIPVCPPVSSLFASGLIANPMGVEVEVGDRFVFEVIITSLAGGSTLWNLTVDLQNSCDNGQTWNDVANVTALNRQLTPFLSDIAFRFLPWEQGRLRSHPSLTERSPATPASRGQSASFGGSNIRIAKARRLREASGISRRLFIQERPLLVRICTVPVVAFYSRRHFSVEGASLEHVWADVVAKCQRIEGS